VSAPSMDLDPAWFSTLKELNVVRNQKRNTVTTNTLRRSVRIRERLSRDDLKTTEDTAPLHSRYMSRARRDALLSQHRQSSFAPC
jgi:hypothetical protein